MQMMNETRTNTFSDIEKNRDLLTTQTHLPAINMTLPREEDLLSGFIPNIIIFCSRTGLMRITKLENPLKKKDLCRLYRPNVIVKSRGNLLNNFIDGVTRLNVSFDG